MYSTCLFCNQSLGANDVLEAFPVGRRLAFDSTKGRLWVVCRRCERWNLSPLEERWEVVETCERLFRETRMRASTENIGLARLHEGLELVRIGEPLRPEFAAWRYGDQFGRRRRRAIVQGVGGVAILGTGLIGGAGFIPLATAAGVSSILLASLWGKTINNRFAPPHALTKLKTSDGTVLWLNDSDLRGVRFVLPSATEERWCVIISKGEKRRVFQGKEAERIAGLIVPRMNRMGGNAATVQKAVKQLEDSGGPDGFLRSSVLDPHGFSDIDVRGHGPNGEPALRVAELPTPLRLAVEMALHEEQERRMLEDELQALAIAWRDAEQIAAISDDLLLLATTEAFLDRNRSERSAAEE